MKKCLYIISTLLFIFLLIGVSISSRKLDWREADEFDLVIKDQTISLWKDKDICYAFIPGWANDEDISFNTYGNEIAIDGVKLYDGNKMCFLYDVEYNLSVNDVDQSKIIFRKMSAVSNLYITSVNGLDSVCNSKRNKEQVRVDVYTKNGEIDYHSTDVKIKSRGNTTFLLDKKSFTLTLPEETSLLSMSNSNKYVLLSNGYDRSNLKNKIVFDFANSVCSHWNPESEFVDVYIDGEYQGLYLLTEKIEVADNKVNLHDNSFLLCEGYENRWDELNNPIMTSEGRVFSVEYPQKLSDKELAKLQSKIDCIEQSIISGEFVKNPANAEAVDSLVSKYLIEEIFANPDLASLYFCYDGNRNLLYAGPVWDYDNAFGYATFLKYTLDSRSFIMNQLQKRDADLNPWYSYMYWQDAFYERLVEIYKKKYLPELNDLLSVGLDRYIESIEASEKCNYIRWETMFSQQLASATASDIKNFMRERVAFLNSAWIYGEEYNTIKVDLGNGSNYRYYSVRKGDVYDSYPSTKDLRLPDNCLFIDQKTNQPYDFNKRILDNQNIVVIDSTKHINDSIINRCIQLIKKQIDILLEGSMILFFFSIFVIMVIVDSRERR